MPERPLTAWRALPALLTLSLFSACSTPSFGPTVADVPPAPPEIPPAIKANEIVGRWGYAAFHKPDDRARTETAARNQCRNPVVIGAGPNGGVMMYPADSNKLEEMRMKGAPGNRTFVGPPGEAGSMQDREITSFDGRVMLMRFVDPEVAGRYGTGVYVRCAPRA
jgi:hypothetical protein